MNALGVCVGGVSRGNRLNVYFALVGSGTANTH
ncbi:hypothetical protein ALQ79_200384 [Pseudomonas amygdali pv. lachrymans]|nr:hypothetical protein ALQ79_200384 [Pseudomonas amygdali pv. lachrymans]